MSGWAGFWIMVGLIVFASSLETAGRAIARAICIAHGKDIREHDPVVSR